MKSTTFKENVDFISVERYCQYVKYSDPIPLLDYKEMYDENPNKATLHLMRRIGDEIQKNITYIKDKSKADFLEHLLILSRKGMNHEHFDRLQL